jgi:predicted O-linked N-acetylglucosamine transferase (SPINDLY family)
MGASNADVVTPEQEALRLIEAGNAIEQEGRMAEALRHYEAAVKLAPNLPRAHLNRGNVLLEMGDADGALAAYATALRENPDYAAAHYNTGNAYARSGRGESALVAYRKAIALNPEFADAEVALGSTLEDLGRLDDAAASYRRALSIKPDYAEVHGNLGLTLKRLGHVDDAVASYRRALSLKPDRAELHNYLGEALQEQGQLDGAATSYRQALNLRPDYILALNNLGNVLQDLGQGDAAVASYRQALTLNPDLAEVHNNLGNALKGLGRFAAARASFHRALEINSGLAIVHYNLGNALADEGRLHAAIESFRQALRIDPGYVDAHCNLGNALFGVGQLHDALACYHRVLELNPDYVLAHVNIGNVLRDLGQPEAAGTSYREALGIDPGSLLARSNLLFSLNYRADQGATTMLAEARRYGDLVARQARPFTAWRNSPDPARRLRVGFVSGDLRNHAVGHFAEGVLAALASTAADRPEIFAYSNHFSTDEVAQRIKASCDRWHLAAGLSDQALAHRIHDDQIDILVDLSGHTEHNRLSMFAWKPAPVQATWLGYLATTGVAAIDYIIADPWTLPASDEVSFTERIWRLPESYLCFTPPASHAQVTPLPALTRHRVTFGSFNNLAKMNDDVVALWSRLLRAVPDSRLLLKARLFGDALVRQRVVARFGVHGIDAGRLILMSFAPMADYLAPYQGVDVSLDPFPYPGITTTVESLWMGVPVLTLAGTTFLSRQGIGVLTNAGLPEWIAVDAEDYVARAAAYTCDLSRLASLRSGLREQVLASPVFDSTRIAGHLAAAFRGMWQEWCRQQKDRAA